MRLFHDEEDTVTEPVRGLPAAPPADEHVVWQGSPAPWRLFVEAFRPRLIAVFFATTVGARIAIDAGGNVAASVAGSAAALAIGLLVLAGIAHLMARSTIYTITNRRIMLRFGVAIRKYVNIPFAQISALSMKETGGKIGNIAIATTDPRALGPLRLWPHVRAAGFMKSSPTLRAIPNVAAAATALTQAMKAAAPGAVTIAAERAVNARTSGSAAPAFAGQH